MRAKLAPGKLKLKFTESLFGMQYVSRETNAKVAMACEIVPRGTELDWFSGVGATCEDKAPVRQRNSNRRAPLKAAVF
jgi:hypothetical protein